MFHISLWSKSLKSGVTTSSLSLITSNVLVSLPDSSYVCIDTEFPGFINHTPIGASSQQRYVEMKRNVEAMKLIQLGFTLYSRDGPSIGSSWQINFREFDPCVDVHVVNSIQLLMNCGINFKRKKRDGVDESFFARLFWQKVIYPCRNRLSNISIKIFYS